MLEAKSQIQEFRSSSSTRHHQFSICVSSDNHHQYRRNLEVKYLSRTDVFVHNFLNKEQYLQHLANCHKYIVVSNCLQFNPQWFFCLMSGTIPFVNGISRSFFTLYPNLYDLSIVDYSLFGLNSFLNLTTVRNSGSPLLPPSFQSSSSWSGEISSLLNIQNCQDQRFIPENYCSLGFSNLSLFTEHVVQYLALYEVAQQLIKYSSHYYDFKLLFHDDEFNRFLFDDLCIATESYVATICFTLRIEPTSIMILAEVNSLDINNDEFCIDLPNLQNALDSINYLLRDRYRLSIVIDLTSIIELLCK